MDVPLSPAAYQALIVDQVGDTDDHLIQAQVRTLWAKYPNLDDLTRYLRVRIDAYGLLRARLRRDLANASEEAKVRALGIVLQTLAADLASAEKELAEVAAEVQETQPPATGDLTTVAGQTAPYGWRDANDPRYAGNPYTPPFGAGQGGPGWGRW